MITLLKNRGYIILSYKNPTNVSKKAGERAFAVSLYKEVL